jgi:HD-GYP domain-containing protein (c-di-GMP phosphodiesterase class II)
MAHREVSVDALEFGMFVAKLDRPWTETPFMFQGFVLKTEQQLTAIRKYCKTVYVDPEKEDRSVARGAGGGGGGEKIRGDVVYKEVASVEAEAPRARAAIAQTTTVVESLSKAVSTGNALDGPRVKEAVTQITASVERNPDAMLLLTRLQQQSEHTLNRAMQISVYMIAFGRFLQLPHDRLELLGMLGLLQDVGMLKLPAGLAERRNSLSGKELETFRTHVDHSAETLSKTPGLPPELPGLATLHHERFDGSGYPRGLKANAIPLLGWIAGIVDTFDMMTAPKPYGEQMPPSTALNVLYNNRGSQFHAALVEQYIQCVGVFPVGSTVELNSGEIAVVIAQNAARRLQPRVMVVRQADGNPMHPHKILDLVKEPKMSPDEPYRIRRTLEHGTVQLDPRELFL